MARTKPTDAGPGHNSAGELSDDDLAALVCHHELKLLDDQRKLDAILVDAAAQRKVVNADYKRMTADIGYTRKAFQSEVVDKANQTEAEYVAAEAKRLRLHKASGRPVAKQVDWVEEIGDTADDAARAYAAGYRVGHVAGDPKPECDPIFASDWMRGWHEAQSDNAKKLGRAAEIIAERAQAKGELTEGEDEPEVEEDIADPEVIAAKARKLKKAGWTEPTADEAALETAA